MYLSQRFGGIIGGSELTQLRLRFAATEFSLGLLKILLIADARLITWKE